MSFKRDGDDTALLKNLSHRRVSELLGEHIPDDEARLMSNGKLTCTVCCSRPIFDTINMLSIHRKGKKHIYELSRYLQHKRELDLRKTKQDQKNLLKNSNFVLENITKLDEKSETILPSPIKIKRRRSFGSRPMILELSATRVISEPIKAPQRSETAEVRQYLKLLSRKKPLLKTINRSRENRVENVQEDGLLPEDNATSVKGNTIKNKLDLEETKKYLKMKEDGWIQDQSGEWVKDPNVEFDSDEDT